MGYNFYGWREAIVAPVNNEYEGIDNPRMLYEALRHIWCEYTCAPRLRSEWSEENITLGQCSITAFLVQDIFGGEVYGIPREGGNFHCYNVVDGHTFDLTSEQFGDEVLSYENNPIQNREEHFKKTEKFERYVFLKKELKNYLIGHAPTGLPGGFFIYRNDSAEKILFAEENVIKMYGCETLDEFRKFVGNSFRGMVHPEDLVKVENQIQAQTMYGEKRHDYVRYRIITKQGEVKYIEDFGHLLHGTMGESYFYVFIVDVDQNEYLNHNINSYAEAEILSMNNDTDTLTGLFNMSFFYKNAQIMMQRPENRRKNFSIIHFDIPNFKLFNERNGFRLGDVLLCDMAKTIKKNFSNGIVSRFSDDHFVVMVMDDKDTVISKVENTYKAILLSDEPAKRVRIKAGIFYMDDQMTELGLACDHARLACNSIKSRHDINYCVYDEGLREKLRKQQYVIDHIDEAIENEYIKVYYQPVIRVKTGEICGYEALVRWVDPKLGILSPADFIETLEQYHIIHKLDMYMIDRVCMDYRRMIEEDYCIVPASINLSRLDFELFDITEYLEEARSKYNVPVNMIELEITESVLNDDFERIKKECDLLKDKGYNIWLDDFGSGYSSLNTLAEYSFDVIKLDLVFLRSYDKNPKTATLMKYIISGIWGMAAMPLCEGVETEEHFRFLKEINCEKAQGYLFGKPMPMDELKKYVEDHGMTWEKYEFEQ